MSARERRLFAGADDVPWWIHRVATSEEYSDGLVDIKERWSVLDLYHALRALDVFDRLRRDEAKRLEKKGRSK